MAIGDKPNQNLFGTNYNPEEEERKKAELAAQGAMMGAGNVPASAFGQAPAVAPFSMEADGQVNPMMEQQSLATESVSNLITNNPFLSTGETPVAAQPPVKNALLEMLERADEREAQGLPRQAAPGIIDAPVETPSVGAQEQPGAVVSPFLQSPDTPSGLGGPLLDGFNRVNDSFRAPNAPMGQDATRAALGGMTLNEYLNAPAGTEGVSGLRTDPQGRMIPNPAPAAVNNFAPQASGGQVGPAKVSDEIMSQVARPAGQTEEFRDGNRDGIEDREQGIFRPGELIGYDAQGNEVRSPGTQQPVNRIPASSQPPVDALSSFEQDSLARQQRIGGTGSFEGDSEARDARVRASDRQPGESQADRDTRVAQSKTTGGQTGGMSFDDARRRAEGQLATRGVKNPSASQVNALARSIQAGEPERLAELETKRAKDVVDLKTAQATLNRPEFEGRVYTVNGVTFAQTSRGGAQVIDTGTETPQESTAQMKDFVFTLEQIDKAREAFAAGNVDKANDIITAAGIQKNGFDVTASEYFGGLTQQQEANITRQAFDTMEEAEAANLPEGTKITIGGRNATV